MSHLVISPRMVEKEVARFETVLEQVRSEFATMKSEMGKSPTDIGAFIDLHMMILADPELSEVPKQIIRERRCNAEWAIVQQMEFLVAQFEKIGDAYLRERSYDAVSYTHLDVYKRQYVTTTWLLSRAEVEGARIFNRPQALRDHSEKFSVAEFAQFAVPTLVSREPAVIHDFIDTQHDVILKPLDGMGGSQIFRVRNDDPNRNVIVETLVEDPLSHDGTRTIMAQRYIPEITDGDKRILPVSYTHLDVYKRQALSSLRYPPPSARSCRRAV